MVSLLSPAAEAALVEELVGLKRHVHSGCIHVDAWDARARRKIQEHLAAAASTSAPPLRPLDSAVARLRLAERLCCRHKLVSEALWEEMQRGATADLLRAFQGQPEGQAAAPCIDPLAILKDLWLYGLVGTAAWKEFQEQLP